MFPIQNIINVAASSDTPYKGAGLLTLTAKNDSSAGFVYTRVREPSLSKLSKWDWRIKVK